MCIICAKPKGGKLPNESYLKNCFIGNPQGAGIGYVRAGENVVNIVKGFMKWEDFIGGYKLLAFKPEDSFILHFRLATHGLSDGGNCHPFPISKREEDLRALKFSTSLIMAHNGIFFSMPEHDRLSDSQKFIVTVLSDENIINGLNNPAIQELLKGYCGSQSKLVFLKADGEMVFIGDWKQKKYCFYSNDGFKGNVIRYAGYNSKSVSGFWPYYRRKDYIERGRSCDGCGRADVDVVYSAVYEGYLCDRCIQDFSHYSME